MDGGESYKQRECDRGGVAVLLASGGDVLDAVLGHCKLRRSHSAVREMFKILLYASGKRKILFRDLRESRPRSSRLLLAAPPLKRNKSAGRVVRGLGDAPTEGGSPRDSSCR